MGDLQRKTSLADKVLTRQKIQRETVHEENHTIDRVVPAAKRKNKAISARSFCFEIYCGRNCFRQKRQLDVDYAEKYYKYKDVKPYN